MLEKILVPLDGSKLAELSLIYLEELANTFNSDIFIIHVCEKPDSKFCHTAQVYLEKVASDLQIQLTKAGSSATVQSATLEGKPAAEIIQYAQQKQINLIIITSHGRTGIKAWVMGSIANKVVHLSHLPTLLIRNPLSDAEGLPGNIFRKILVPLDGSESGESSLPYVKEIAKKFDSEVTLLSIVEGGERVHSIGGLDYIQFPVEFIDVMKKESENYLARVSKTLTDSGIIVQNVVREGNAAEEIVTFGNENNIGLITLSSYGKSDSHEWVLGSVANKVLHVSKLPMLLVRTVPSDAQGLPVNGNK